MFFVKRYHSLKKIRMKKKKMKMIYLNALNLLQHNMLEVAIQQKNSRLNADI